MPTYFLKKLNLLKKKYADAYVLKINNLLYQIEGGGHVNHLHFHIIPRYKNDGGIDTVPAVAEKSELMKVKKQIGNIYSSLTQNENAKDAYNKVLEINPKNTAAQNALKSLE